MLDAAFDMKCPTERYLASPRHYDGLPELIYPFHDRELLVTACGRLCLHRKRINISTVLAGQKFGIKQVDDGIWLASFMHYDVGYFDLKQKNLAATRQQPVRHEVVTHVLGTVCYLCVRAGQSLAGGESVSQLPLKDNAFSTFLDQNPPFELPPKWGSAFDKNLSRSMARHRQHRRQATRVPQPSRCVTKGGTVALPVLRQITKMSLLIPGLMGIARRLPLPTSSATADRSTSETPRPAFTACLTASVLPSCD
jgi:hypothetical protein